MKLRISGDRVAEQAITGHYVGTPYNKLDCQGFVEQVLKDLDIRKENGSFYNWKGSNSMWRNHIKWRGSIEECKTKFGCIPNGAFLFLLKWDGGEKGRGYNDGLGNASHVGLYLGTSPLPCMDSQSSRGVDYCKLNVFTHVGLMDMIDYYNDPEPSVNTELDAIHTIRDPDSTDKDVLTALKILTKYLKGV